MEIQPWTSINPVTFMMGPACMLLRSAEFTEAIDQFDDATKQQMAQALEDALARIAFAGTEQLNGRPTLRLRIEELNMVQPLEPVASLAPGVDHRGRNPVRGVATDSAPASRAGDSR